MPLHYIVREPKVASKNPPLLVLIHGYGSHEEDLFSFANELPSQLLIVSLRAPLSLDFGGYAWYSINFEADANVRSNNKEAMESILKIEKTIEKIKIKYHTDADKTFLLGFSQGCILSIALGLRNPLNYKNIIALSGYVNEKLLPKDVAQKDVSQIDFFVSHGNVDQVLPVEWARKTPLFFDSLNIKHTYQEYPVGHGVAPQNFFDLKNWIEHKLSVLLK